MDNAGYSSWASLHCVRCGVNEYVSNNACVACPFGTANDAGDDVAGSNTSCLCWIESNDVLRSLVDDWIADPNPLRHVCGQIDTWDVSRVTDMSYLFCALNETWTPLECNANRRSFNADISRWDVSNVTSLEGTFLGTTAFDLDRISQWDLTRVETFEKNTFTFLNPRNHICTKTNVHLTAKSGVRRVFDRHTFDCKKENSHIQVRMNTANKLICLQLARCVSFVHDDVHTCSSSLCEWSIEYCKTRVHIESTSLSYGDTANDGRIPIRFILTDTTNEFTVDDVECVGGELLDFQRQEPLIYTATFNSAVSSTDTRRIIVPAHVFTDSHGASNHESVFQWNYDNSRPDVTIRAEEGVSGFTSDDAKLSLRFTSSEPTIVLSPANIMISGGGLLTSLTRIDDMAYTASFIPEGESLKRVVVNENVFQDKASNWNLASNTFEWTFKCDDGYHADNFTCTLNSCKCLNGDGPTGTSCPTHDDEICIRCDAGYRLENSQCYPDWSSCAAEDVSTHPDFNRITKVGCDDGFNSDILRFSTMAQC